MNNLVFIASPYIGMVLMYLFLSQLMPKKWSYWKILLFLLPEGIPSVFKILLGSTSGFVQVVNVTIMIYGILLLPVFCFDCPKWKSISLAVFFYAIVFLVDALCYNLFAPIFGPQGELFNTSQIVIYTGVVWCLYALVCVLIIWIFRMLRFQKFQPFYLLYLVFPVSQGIMLYCSIYGNIRGLWFFGILLSIGAQIALLVNTISQENKTQLENQLRDARHMMELVHTHYKEVENRQEELARIRHDFNNQLATIGQLIRNGDDTEANQMVQELSEAIKRTKENPYCSIPVVNAVLTEKERTCMDKNIRLEVELDLPSPFPMDSMPLCSIFSNLMDNAIHGAETVEDGCRWIRLAAKTDGDYLFIKATNASQPPVPKQTQGHGYGKLILEDLAKHYNGSMHSTYEDGVYTAVLCLELNL